MAKKLTLAQQRQANYTRLRYDGFTVKEATDLVSTKRKLPSGRITDVPLLDLKIPFIKTMIRTRERAWERARLRGESRVKFEKRVKARNAKKGILSIWDLVRQYEEKYIKKHPEYRKEKKEKTPVTRDGIKLQQERVRKKVSDTRIVSTHKFANGKIAGYNADGRFVDYVGKEIT